MTYWLTCAMFQAIVCNRTNISIFIKLEILQVYLIHDMFSFFFLFLHKKEVNVRGRYKYRFDLL